MKELMRRMFLTKNVSDIITVFATFVLGSVLLVVVFAMLAGLFIKSIQQDDIFNLISPAFQTIVGAFVGLISGIHLGKKSEAETPTTKTDDSPTTPPQTKVDA